MSPSRLILLSRDILDSMQAHKITEKSFYKYLKCPSWLLDEIDDPENGHDAFVGLLQDEGLLPEQAENLMRHKDVASIELDDIDEAFQETVKLMKEGHQTIRGGALIDGHYSAQPDILEKVEGKSELGNYYYVACDYKRSDRLKDEYKHQGVFYAKMLGKIQGVKPMQGYVIHSSGKISTYLIHDFEADFELLLEQIEDFLDLGDHDVFLTSQCKQSPYFDKCHKRARESRHLSLINRIWRSEVESIEKSGLKTIDDLADASVDDLKKVSGITLDRLYFLQQQAISYVEEKVITLPGIDLGPGDKGLYIDIETDPLRDVHYLFGVLVVENGEEKFKTFYADSPEQEEENWKNFVHFLDDFEEWPIFHYGWHEVNVFRNLTEKYGAPPIVRDMFEEHMIDLIARLRNFVIFPSPFYSLKDIAKHLGFTWRTEEASGLKSIGWYDEWLKTGDSEIKKKIVEYNEDDVRATHFVRDKIAALYEEEN